MSNYIGLDVSLKTTSICIMDQRGKIIRQTVAPTTPQEIAKVIFAQQLSIEKVALECGGMSHWLTQELKKLKLPVICIDARKMSAAISIRTNKTDKNDAQEIANALRTGYYKEVYQKQDDLVEKQTLLTTRRHLIDQRTQTINCIRGILRGYGKTDCGSSQNEQKFLQTIFSVIDGLGEEVILSIHALVNMYKIACEQVSKIDAKIEKITSTDEDIQLLKTIPGVGDVTALAFKLEIDDPFRFKKSRSVGAYLGMTPKQYSSGESQKQGSISKTGSRELRMLLCQSAMSMMYCAKAWSRAKLFGLQIKKKHGHKKATVALGRKLALMMHRMLIEKKAFEPGRVDQKMIDRLEQTSKRKIKKENELARRNRQAGLIV